MINFDEPIIKFKNPNIKVNILSDEKMKEFGFKQYCKDIWSFSKELTDTGICFFMTIEKETKDFEIKVTNSFFEPYDYQTMIRRTRPNLTAIKCHFEVQMIMEQLIKEGIVEGYKLGDYI